MLDTVATVDDWQIYWFIISISSINHDYPLSNCPTFVSTTVCTRGQPLSAMMAGMGGMRMPLGMPMMGLPMMGMPMMGAPHTFQVLERRLLERQIVTPQIITGWHIFMRITKPAVWQATAMFQSFGQELVPDLKPNCAKRDALVLSGGMPMMGMPMMNMQQMMQGLRCRVLSHFCLRHSAKSWPTLKR